MTLRPTRAVALASVAAAVVAHGVLLGADGSAWWPGPIAFALAALVARRGPPGLPDALIGIGPLWPAAAWLVTGHIAVTDSAVWLAAVSGALAGRYGAAGWAAPAPWVLPLASWALTLALTWPIVVARELDFTLATFGAQTPNGTMAGGPAVVSAIALGGTLAQLAGILVFDHLARSGEAARRRLRRGLGASLALAGLVAVFQATVDINVLSREPWPRLGRAAGTFFDANALGAFAALAGPWLAGEAWARGTRTAAAAALGTLVFSLAAVVASGSRTAFAAWVVATLVWGALALRDAAGRDRRMLWHGAAVAALLAAATGLVAWQGLSARGGSDPVSRLLGTLADASGRPGGLSRIVLDRDGYGPASMAMIREHPLAGVGTGAYGIFVSDYAREAVGTALPPDNAQNWWRHQVAELGLLGALGSLALSVLVAAAAMRRLRHGVPRADAGALAATVALGAMAVVSPPTQHPVIQVVVSLVVAVGVGATGVGQRPEVDGRSARRVAVAWALAIACAAGLLVDGWTTLRPPMRAARFGFVYDYGFALPALAPLPGQPAGTQRRWMGRHGVAVLPPAMPLLVVQVALPHEDLATAPVSVRVARDGRDVCVEERRDQAVMECRIPTEGRWVHLDLRVSRIWHSAEGQARGALVTAWYETASAAR